MGKRRFTVYGMCYHRSYDIDTGTTRRQDDKRDPVIPSTVCTANALPIIKSHVIFSKSAVFFNILIYTRPKVSAM
jgi:hypothetical protein